MARIKINWVVEARGCVLYDYTTGDELTVFITDEFGGDELGDTLVGEWNGANQCWRWPNYPDTSYSTKCYRTGFDSSGRIR